MVCCPLENWCFWRETKQNTPQGLTQSARLLRDELLLPSHIAVVLRWIFVWESPMGVSTYGVKLPCISSCYIGETCLLVFSCHLFDGYFQVLNDLKWVRNVRYLAVSVY